MVVWQLVQSIRLLWGVWQLEHWASSGPGLWVVGGVWCSRCGCCGGEAGRALGVVRSGCGWWCGSWCSQSGCCGGCGSWNTGRRPVRGCGWWYGSWCSQSGCCGGCGSWNTGRRPVRGVGGGMAVGAVGAGVVGRVAGGAFGVGRTGLVLVSVTTGAWARALCCSWHVTQAKSAGPGSWGGPRYGRKSVTVSGGQADAATWPSTKIAVRATRIVAMVRRLCTCHSPSVMTRRVTRTHGT